MLMILPADRRTRSRNRPVQSRTFVNRCVCVLYLYIDTDSQNKFLGSLVHITPQQCEGQVEGTCKEAAPLGYIFLCIAMLGSHLLEFGSFLPVHIQCCGEVSPVGKYHQIHYARILPGLTGQYFAWPSYHPIWLSCIQFHVDIDMIPIFVGPFQPPFLTRQIPNGDPPKSA